MKQKIKDISTVNIRMKTSVVIQFACGKVVFVSVRKRQAKVTAKTTHKTHTI